MKSLANIAGCVDDIMATCGDHPELLLQYLCRIQWRYNCIPPEAIELLAVRLGLPVAHIRGVIGFYAFLHETPRGDFNILVSDSITDQMLGSRALLDSLCRKLGVQAGVARADGRATVDTTSCTGMCDQGPALLVNGFALTRLDMARVDAIAAFVEAGTPVQDWPATFFSVEDNIRRRDRLLNAPRSTDGALQVFLQQGADAVLQTIDRSGLRGRGGAGFKTASKWRFCRQAPGGRRYVVCNADEGEPGTFKDRVLLNSYADEVFEGMTLCAGITGAQQGYLYLRGEYRYLLESLESVLARRRSAGLLGRDILGRQGFEFDIAIHMGAGAYVCGEESALIESLEGKRGIPRKRPPFPVTQGLRQQPTVVNNVETLFAATYIARFGADWFRASGTEQSTGTKLLSVSGDCARPGIYEYPLGVTVGQVIEDCGAGHAQAAQLAGAAGTIVPGDEFDTRISYEDVDTGGAFMVFGPERDLLDMVRNFMHFFAHESCGFCTPCRVGGTLLKNLVDKVYAGRAGEYDLQKIRDICALMRDTSHCGLGAATPNPVMSTLEKFPSIYRRRLCTSDYEPAFDLEAELEEARRITGRDDSGAHIGRET
jgi:[NiFe] hydrogenase diaphorase moiety large subunit